MKNHFLFLLIFVAFTFAGYSQEVTITASPDSMRYSINRNIYGHFSEHLGHCIYDGIWVGENSTIPNTRGMRNDVIKALNQLMTIPTKQ